MKHKPKVHHADEGTIVECYWVDSCGPDSIGWMDIGSIHVAVASCRTAGIVMHTDEDNVVIALSLDGENGNVRDWITIPQVAITSWSVVWPAK